MSDTDFAVQDTKLKLKKPPLFKVMLLNDDFTPMDFVVEVLTDYFNMNKEKATHVMLQVHTEGVGICGIYVRDVAETKVHIVNQYSRTQQYPLMCSMTEA